MTENEAWAQKVFRFIAYVNQSDWRAKQLLRLLDCLQDAASVQRCIQQAYSEALTRRFANAPPPTLHFHAIAFGVLCQMRVEERSLTMQHELRRRSLSQTV